jgi:hypothetical protein
MKKRTRRDGLAAQLGRVQAEAERVLARGYEATLEWLPDGPREAVEDTVEELASQLDAQRAVLRKRGRQVLKSVDQQRRVLLGNVDKAVKRIERRGERALNTIKARRARLLDVLERGTAQVMQPLAHGLDLATRGDLERLSHRVAQLERGRRNGTRRAAA